MTQAARTANVLGALSLAVADRTAAAQSAATGQSTSALAALSSLAEFLVDPSLDQLGKVLGLTHSGTVRLVDRLVDDGLATRRAGTDGRSRAVRLTAKGRTVARRAAAARSAGLADLLDGLDPSEVDALEPLLARLVGNLVRVKDGGAWVCRSCDLTACERPAGRCPTATAAAERYGR